MDLIIAYRLLDILVILLSIAGLFGNFLIFISVIRHRDVRSKHTVIFMVMVFLHTYCIAYELVGVFRGLRTMAVTQTGCLHWLGSVVFVVFMQSAMFIPLSADVALAVAVPLRHKYWRKTPYVVLMCVPPFLFAASTIAYYYFHTDDTKTVAYCSVLTAIPESATHWLAYVFIGFLVVSFFLAISAALIVSKQEKTMRSSRKSHSSISVETQETQVLCTIAQTVLIFSCSWFFCVFIMHLLHKIDLGDEWGQILKSYTELLALIAFSQAFYVLYWRYPRYRSVFQEDLHWLSCGVFFKEHKETKQTAPSSQNTKQNNGVV